MLFIVFRPHSVVTLSTLFTYFCVIGVSFRISIFKAFSHSWSLRDQNPQFIITHYRPPPPSSHAKKKLVFHMQFTHFDVTASGHVAHMVLGADLWPRPFLKVQLNGLDFFVATARLMPRIFQRSDFRLGTPLQLGLCDLQEKLYSKRDPNWQIKSA